MKKLIVSGLFVSTLAVAGLSQTSGIRTAPTPSRVIVTSTLPPIQPAKTPQPMTTAAPRPAATPIIVGQKPQVPSQTGNMNFRSLSFAQIKSKIAEAKRQMMVKPMNTASVQSTQPSSLVRIAYYDWRDREIDYIVIPKDQFLTANLSTSAISTRGKQMITRTIRANGVNTPIIVTDANGQAQLPLLVQYPVEKGGKYIETAYYMSTHPGLVTPEVVGAGRLYVHNLIDVAREKLRERGFAIQPRVADIAERLATVEHVDHIRFKTETPSAVFNDIYTLYALNEGQTFRYSVSTAGAGGMVQMIPSTYAMIRSHYPGAGLMPDFVEGMRNHVNATQAMLLYMQMTWTDLLASPTVDNAYRSGVATQEQLMAVGYNSNPAKIAGYINRSGSNWTSLIPHETKLYLQVYSELEHAFQVIPRAK